MEFLHLNHTQKPGKPTRHFCFYRLVYSWSTSQFGHDGYAMLMIPKKDETGAQSSHEFQGWSRKTLSDKLNGLPQMISEQVCQAVTKGASHAKDTGRVPPLLKTNMYNNSQKHADSDRAWSPLLINTKLFVPSHRVRWGRVTIKKEWCTCQMMPETLSKYDHDDNRREKRKKWQDVEITKKPDRLENTWSPYSVW